jgi:ribose transport system permease protein
MDKTRIQLKKLLSDYGMLAILLLLCLFFSLLTLKQQQPQGQSAAKQLANAVAQKASPGERVLVVAGTQKASQDTARMVVEMLGRRSFSRVMEVRGTPRDLRLALDRLRDESERPAAIAVTSEAVEWRVWEILPEAYPEFGQVTLVTPETYYWPDFLKLSILLAVVDRIVVIAIIAIGMTMVIITAGIDLSVGSLIALSGVISTLVMKQLGGLGAPAWTVAAGFLIGIVSCGLLGAFGGFLVARFKVAPFITTLALMMVARGLAFSITGGFSIYQVPEALTWLGQGRSLGIPNTVILLAVLYAGAHIFMSRTTLGRYIYAVGGNEEAARLSGVPVAGVIVFVYVVSAVAAGVGGCIQASQLNAGTPNAGLMYELYVIAAVVVGGTSLSGGSGTILGTLIGAFIISVVQNGMNLLGIESYTQNVVLGMVILGAVLLDRLRGGASLAFLTGRGSAD